MRNIDFNLAASSGGGQQTKSTFGRNVRLCEITQSSPDSIIGQLIGNDRVHAAGTDSVENLRRHRLGGPGMNRSCYALMDDFNILSVIYIHKTYAPVKSERDLCGNVRDILASESVSNPATPKSFIFYSISAIAEVKGAGVELISRTHTALKINYSDAVLSTLSPLRQPTAGSGIEDYLRGRAENFGKMDAREKRAAILPFLLDEREPVRSFHLGNGATIGYIHTDADSVGDGARPMVNYIYTHSAEKLAANKAAFRAGDLSQHVSQTLREETGYCPLTHSTFVAPAPAIR